MHTSPHSNFSTTYKTSPYQIPPSNLFSYVFSLKTKTWSCQPCGKTFRSYSGIYKHKKQVHGNDVPTHHCTKCPKSFLHATSLKRHVAETHKYIYTCSHCPNTYSRLIHMDNHNCNKHDGTATVHACPWDGITTKKAIIHPSTQKPLQSKTILSRILTALPKSSHVHPYPAPAIPRNYPSMPSLDFDVICHLTDKNQPTPPYCSTFFGKKTYNRTENTKTLNYAIKQTVYPHTMYYTKTFDKTRHMVKNPTHNVTKIVTKITPVTKTITNPTPAPIRMMTIITSEDPLHQITTIETPTTTTWLAKEKPRHPSHRLQTPSPLDNQFTAPPTPMPTSPWTIRSTHKEIEYRLFGTDSEDDAN